MMVLTSPHSCQHSVLLVFFIIAILMAVRVYLITAYVFLLFGFFFGHATFEISSLIGD